MHTIGSFGIHPEDAKALRILQNIPGFPALVKKVRIQAWMSDRSGTERLQCVYDQRWYGLSEVNQKSTSATGLMMPT